LRLLRLLTTRDTETVTVDHVIFGLLVFLGVSCRTSLPRRELIPWVIYPT
jgi:hypothetical protein